MKGRHRVHLDIGRTGFSLRALASSLQRLRSRGDERQHGEARARDSRELLRAVDSANVLRHLHGHPWQDLTAKLLHERAITGFEAQPEIAAKRNGLPRCGEPIQIRGRRQLYAA